MSTQTIVVGGGLAGMSAAHSVINRGGRVLLLDKSAFLGGNSTKATSGINGSLTRTQVEQNVPDSPEIFHKDILAGACGVGFDSPPDTCLPLAKVLAYESGPAVNWLMDNFGLDLSKLALMGGHSHKRTHRGGARFPGFTITYTMIEKLEEIEEKSKGEIAKIVTKARVTELIKDAAGRVTGCKYTKDGAEQVAHGNVILCSGGFGADFTKDSLLMKFRPDLGHLPTTNGEHCTGDGVKIGMAIGAGTIDMKSVQVHPTGVVHPDEPDSKTKWLAAEALRGVGGIILNAEGKRFVNELGRRDYVSGKMFAGKGPFRLVLNNKASEEILWHCKHYCGRGVMKKVANGTELAEVIGCSPEAIRETFAHYNAAAAAGVDNVDTEIGKKFFVNTPYDFDNYFHVAMITPIVHYTMGGLKIDVDSQVCEESGKKIPGLYAAGELAGGVHGRNRLGGNSLLDCVVYGRVAGHHSTVDQLSQNIVALKQAKAMGRVAKLNAHLKN